MLRARSARAFDNATNVKGPCTLKKRGATEQLFKSNKKEQWIHFLVVLQKLLSCSSQFSQSTKQGNPCQIFAHSSSALKAQIMKNVPAGISESFARLRFSFPVAGFFGGRLRPEKGAQVPENSLKQFRKPKPQILISCGWIFWRPAAAR